MIELDAGRVWLTRGVLHEVITVSHVQLEHVMALRSAARTLREKSRADAPVFVDIRAVRWASSEARGRGSSELGEFVASAVALLVGSPVSRIVGSLFLRMSTPPFPLRLFTSYDEAMRWLADYAPEANSEAP